MFFGAVTFSMCPKLSGEVLQVVYLRHSAFSLTVWTGFTLCLILLIRRWDELMKKGSKRNSRLCRSFKRIADILNCRWFLLTRHFEDGQSTGLCVICVCKWFEINPRITNMCVILQGKQEQLNVSRTKLFWLEKDEFVKASNPRTNTGCLEFRMGSAWDARCVWPPSFVLL